MENSTHSGTRTEGGEESPSPVYHIRKLWPDCASRASDVSTYHVGVSPCPLHSPSVCVERQRGKALSYKRCGPHTGVDSAHTSFEPPKAAPAFPGCCHLPHRVTGHIVSPATSTSADKEGGPYPMPGYHPITFRPLLLNSCSVYVSKEKLLWTLIFKMQLTNEHMRTPGSFPPGLWKRPLRYPKISCHCSKVLQLAAVGGSRVTTHRASQHNFCNVL